VALQQVADAVGIKLATLNRHFLDVPTLFAAVVLELRTTTIARWHEACGGHTDPLARLQALATFHLTNTGQQTVGVRLLHRALLVGEDDWVKLPLRDFYLECEGMLARIIAEGQQTGVFRRSLDPRVGAWELIRTALGHTLTRRLDIPLHAEADYLPRAIACTLQCLLKTDV
jgi:AcrR family transcriptional regulator